MTDPHAARLRILHVSEVHWGGVVTLLRQYVAEQQSAGHEVHVLAPQGMPHLPGSVRHTWPIERSRLTTQVPSVRTLRSVVRSVRPDVVHLHSFVAGQLGRLPGVLSTRRSMRPAVAYQPHAWSQELFSNSVARQAVERAERWASARTDVLVVNCQDEADAGRRLGVHVPARVLGVAVDLSRFRPPTQEERHRARLELGLNGQSVVLVLGRLAHQKGQDLLVPVWERNHRPGEVLALVGPGDPSRLRDIAPRTWGSSIRAVGEPADVLPWLWAADVLAMPSRYETVGLVSAEAMATGVPVVATAFAGARETILEGGQPAAGSVVGLSDMEGLLHEVRRRLDDPDLQRLESEAGRHRAHTLFRPTPMADRLESAYRYAMTAAHEGDDT